MKTTKISELPIAPEEYGADIYNQVDWSSIDSEMTDAERRYINGLVQYYQPQSILEVGVSIGGGTVNLLNAMDGIPGEGILYSVDRATRFYRNPDLPVGHCAIEKYSGRLNKSWHLITGEDPATAMGKIDRKFDFCVIDTLHDHPVETLNFISVLPWLNDGAIVVMHDTTVFEWRTERTYLRMLAPRLLLSVVCAEKHIPVDLPSWSMTTSNIAAWQVGSDTRKYCQNLFDILYFPWETSIPTETYQNMCALIEKHYSGKLLGYFQEAARINGSMLLAKQFDILSFERSYSKLREDTIFYGAGARMSDLLSTLAFAGVEFNFPIWDKNAGSIKEINGCIVSKPDYETPAKNEQIMIVTIEDEQIANEVKIQFEALGFKVFHGLKEYLGKRG